MKHFKFYILFIFLCSCSTNKDKFLNRNFHALVTKYNVLYNGKLAYKKGLEKVEETYSDDYTELLPVEPFSFYANQNEAEDVEPIGQSNFTRAEEKATKAIQRHSMLIRGEERNHQVDDAYLLLGKSRYYTKRFGPALDAFEYILTNYKNADLILETVVWRAKSKIHNDNVDFAKRSLTKLLKLSDLPPKVRQQAEIGLIMAYEKESDGLSSIIKHLEASLNAVNEGSIASRLSFILGQAYRKQGDITKSDKAFDQTIEMKDALYRFKLQAKLEKMKNHLNDIGQDEFLKKIDHMIFITKNRRYLGRLFFTKGEIYQEIDSLQSAKMYYTKSVQKSENDADQKILSYLKLGDLFYNQKEYAPAKAYYDSLVQVAQNKKSKKVVLIKRKAKSLEKVVAIQKQAFANDSLLQIARFNESELNNYFKDHIEKIKKEEKELRKKKLRNLEKQNSSDAFSNNNDWYFFSNIQRTKGKKEFIKKWRVYTRGKNWYSSRLRTTTSTIAKEVKDSTLTQKQQLSTPETNKYDIAFYTDQVNKNPVFLDSITRVRNLNYYELGNIYHSQLKETKLSVDQLEKLLVFAPSNDLKVGTYYKLYKIYQETENTQKEQFYKEKLNNEFPNSTFSKLANKEKYDTDDEDANEYITRYETIYKLYKEHSYLDAKKEISEVLNKYSDTPLAPKYALLNAYIHAKLEGKETFHKLLKELRLKYPNTPEANNAFRLLKNK